jgi:hypothetical protein
MHAKRNGHDGNDGCHVGVPEHHPQPNPAQEPEVLASRRTT